MGMTERLEEARFAVEVARAALKTWGLDGCRDALVGSILSADVYRASGVLQTIQRRQAAAVVDDAPAKGDRP